MKNLLRFLKNYKKESILAPLFKFLEAVFELIVPLIVKDIVDVGVANADKARIGIDCGILVLLAVVGLLSAVTAQYFAAKAATGFSAELKSALFARLQSLSYREIDKIGTATMITRMTSDCNQVQNGVNMVLRLFLRSPVVVFGALIMAFFVDVKSGILFAVAIPLLALIVFGITRLTVPLYKKSQNNLDGVSLSVKENLSGARVLRAFHKEADEEELFLRRNRAYTKSQTFVSNLSAVMNPATYVVINLAIVALLYTGGVQVQAGSLTQGDVISLYNYMSQILVELIKFSNLIVTITKTIACGNRLDAVLNMKNSLVRVEDDAVYNTDAVAFENVCFRYEGAGANALENINFTAKKGEVVGVIGGTGSGKSSLVNLIPRFYDATAGRVTVNGRNVQSLSDAELIKRIGVVPQRAVLFRGSIRDNLKWGNEDATDEEIFRALAIAQALDVVESKGGLDAEIEQGGRNLSGGQKQRLTIARALVKQPEILILDDSASALDFATDYKLRKALREITATVFIVSQRTSSLQGADKIVVLDDCRQVGLGTHEELLASCDVYREIYHSQFKGENVYE